MARLRPAAERLHPRELALHLARAMEDGATADPPRPLAHRAVGPESYRVRLNPQDADALLAAEPELAERLADELIGLARESGLTLLRRPIVLIALDATVAPHTVAVHAVHAEQATSVLGQTQSSAPAADPAFQAAPAPSAFLIVDGQRHVPLDPAPGARMVTIGRRLDNQVVIDDPRVSRLHAQIRQRFGRWVLFDLSSRGGTQVNNALIAEHVLRPGDVIGLAGATLIYGEDDKPAEARLGETSPTQPLHD